MNDITEGLDISRIPDQARAFRIAIQEQRRGIERAYAAIETLAKKGIPEYHFLNMRVSTFWTCDLSPLGMCVFDLDEQGHEQGCHYCHQPVERK